MCDLTKISKIKSLYIYKVVQKGDDGKYYSPFSKTLLEKGKMPLEENSKYTKDNNLYNKLMIGRVSGFKRFKDAIMLGESFMEFGFNPMIMVVKIKIKANSKFPIVMGTGNKIFNIVFNSPIYAGPIIESIKEVKRFKEKTVNITDWWSIDTQDGYKKYTSIRPLQPINYKNI